MKNKKPVNKKKNIGLRIVNVKVKEGARKRLQANARKYAKGNLSAWLRHAGLRYVPKKGVVIK